MTQSPPCRRPAAEHSAGVAVVVNLTRFGDLLQSQPLVEDLHRKGYGVHLLCLDVFAAALPLLRHVERVWTLPGARLMADTDADWRVAAARLLHLARSVRREARPRCVVNLTTTLPARLLTRLLAADKARVYGFSLEAEGFGRNSGCWASFLNGTTASRLSAPFNLVDMFRMVGAPALADAPETQKQGAPGMRLHEPPAQALTDADALLAAAPPECRGFVAMQPGASEARRQWPARFFAAVGDRLWQEQKLCPVLLGAPAEVPLAEAYAAAARSPHIVATGRTDIPQLAALLMHSRLLVTNDTGTMHLAAGLGVTSLALFLASAQPWDTGPYLPGCCCLEPALDCHPCPYGRPCPNGHACLERISPRSVGDLALAWLNTGRWEAAPLQDIGREARVWLTEREATGFAAVRCLSAQSGEDRSLWLAQQRYFWRQILDNLDLPESAAAGCAAQAPPLPVYSPQFSQVVGAALEQAAQLFDLLAEQGQLMDRSARAGQLFLRNCERLQNLLDACPPLRSLGGFWRELRQDRGDRIPELLRLTRRLGGQLHVWRSAVQGAPDVAVHAGTPFA